MRVRSAREDASRDSGHDTSILPMLLAMNQTDVIWPAYACHLKFEVCAAIVFCCACTPGVCRLRRIATATSHTSTSSTTMNSYRCQRVVSVCVLCAHGNAAFRRQYGSVCVE
jgi:hypothetical protein